jgi:hypothetical protein
MPSDDDAKKSANEAVASWLKDNTARYLWLALSAWAVEEALVRLVGSSLPEITTFAWRGIGVGAVVYVVLLLLALRFSELALRISWVGLGVLLLYTWCLNMKRSSDRWIEWSGGLFLILLVYFVLEGFELAVTDLLDKDSSQLPAQDQSVARALAQVNDKRSVFYDTREWVIVALVVVLTTHSDFDQRFVLPPFRIADDRAHTIFSLLFTTFIIVWISQSPAKLLATKNSLAFLRFWKFTLWWPVIRFVGNVMDQIDLHFPANLIAGCFLRLRAFQTPRNLQPSDPAYFISGLKKYGYAFYQLWERLVINADGGATFSQKGVLYVLDTDKRDFGRWFEFGAAFREKGKKTWAYFAPQPGEMLSKDLAAGLEKIFDHQDPGPGFRRCNADPLLDERPKSLEETQDTSGRITRQRRNYRIFAPPLGEAESSQEATGSAFAIGYEITFLVEAKGFEMPNDDDNQIVSDYILKEVSFPWRKYIIEVQLEDACPGKLFTGPGHATILDSPIQRELDKMHTGHRTVNPR